MLPLHAHGYLSGFSLSPGFLQIRQTSSSSSSSSNLLGGALLLTSLSEGDDDEEEEEESVGPPCDDGIACPISIKLRRLSPSSTLSSLFSLTLSLSIYIYKSSCVGSDGDEEVVQLDGLGTDDREREGRRGRERFCYAGFAPDWSQDCSESVGYVCIQDCD